MSPFVKPTPPQANNNQAIASPLDTLEFNGVMVVGNQTHVSLRDTQTNTNYWLTEEEAAADGLKIVRIQTGNGEDKVVVRRGAATRELSMREFDIITAVAPKAPAVQPVTSKPDVVTSTNRNPNIQSASDDEVRERMKRVAEEIRRRRAMRRTTTEQTQTRTNN